MSLNIQQHQTINLEQRMHLGMKQSDLLELSKTNLRSFIENLENSDLFVKLSVDKDYKAISIHPISRYIPCPVSTKAPAAEKVSGEKTSPDKHGNQMESIQDINLDVESIIDEELAKKDASLFARLKEMPVDLFYYYFIEGEGTDGEIAELLNIRREQAKHARQVIEQALLRGSLSYEESAGGVDTDQLPAEVVAEIYPAGDDIQISFMRERVRYQMDEATVEELVRSKKLSSKEIRDLKVLREKIHLVNSQVNLLHDVVRMAVHTQKAYLVSGDILTRQALEEKQVAELLSIDVSWVSRLVNGKTMQRYIKFGPRAIPLRELFISTRELQKRRGISFIREILAAAERTGRKGTRKKLLTDEELRRILMESYGVASSRRTVNNWLREAVAGDDSHERRRSSTTGQDGTTEDG